MSVINRQVRLISSPHEPWSPAFQPLLLIMGRLSEHPSSMNVPRRFLSNEQHDVRRTVAGRVLERLDQLATDTVTMVLCSASEGLDGDYCLRLGRILLHLLSSAIRDGRLSCRDGTVAALHRAALERSLPAAQIFSFTYLMERSVLDELALDKTIGATSEPWPIVAQLVRRASYDLLGAYTERTQLEPGGSAMVDPLTGLFTRALLDAVLAKEAARAGRFGYPISLILFAVDGFPQITQTHGNDIGDQVLERLSFLIRKYFRGHDWVARHLEDSFAVLLPLTDSDTATTLAESVRDTVEKRLKFNDGRTEQTVPVTVSAAVVSVIPETGEAIDPEHFLGEAEVAMQRAKHQGGNRVARVDGSTKADRRQTLKTDG
jgi:diguanylate cyclase (GGDEF)-like protein